MRFLVDENLTGKLSDLLRSAGHDVLDVATSDLRGSADWELSDLAAEDHRIVISRDLDFPVRGARMPDGLIIVRLPRGFSQRSFIQLFEEFLQSEAFEGVGGRITVFAPGNVRWRSIADG